MLRPRVSALALAACFSVSCAAEADGGSALRGELERLDAVLARVEGANLPEGFRGGIEGARAGLALVRTSRDEDLALYRLRQPLIDLEALSYVVANRPAGDDLGRLEELAHREAPAFAPAAAGAELSGLHLGLYEAAQNRAERLYAAALPYGRIAGPLSGLYYLGEARAHLAYRDLVARMAPRSGAAPAHPTAEETSLRAALDRLDGETVAAFAREPGATTMIGVSARLKEAHELLDSGRLAAATLAVLESRLGLSRRLAAGAPATDPVTALTETVSPPARPAAVGSSLRDLYLAMAAEEEDPTVVRLIRRDVLPLHDALLGSPP
jgi:hypothetical protein